MEYGNKLHIGATLWDTWAPHDPWNRHEDLWALSVITDPQLVFVPMTTTTSTSSLLAFCTDLSR